MLAMADRPIDSFLPYFASCGVDVAFLVPTPTGYEKSIMDATGPVRQLLLDEGVHDYETQGQGPENKHLVPSYFVTDSGLIETQASLYRPVTKHGDPRIWFGNLRRYCSPCNLLALFVINQEIYVANLSDPNVSISLRHHAFVYDLLLESVHQDEIIAQELLHKIQVIHNRGFLPSITMGDPGVGDTLEDALGIQRNCSKNPDYKGIELKASRLTRNGQRKPTTRQTIFTRVPDGGMTYREIVENFGKIQTPKGQTEARLQLYETFRCSRPNAYDLQLGLSSQQDQLNIIYAPRKQFVSSWTMQLLKEALLQKHRETFWVKAQSITIDGREHFRYDKVLHTKHPNPSLLAPLLETDKMTVDLAAHISLDTHHYRDHGVLFKMMPDDLPLLFGEPREYDLTL